jgi:hypothetical protein
MWRDLPRRARFSNLLQIGSRKLTEFFALRIEREHDFIDERRVVSHVSTMLTQFIPGLFSVFSFHSAPHRNIAKDFVSAILKKSL